MKKHITVTAVLFLLIFSLASCSKQMPEHIDDSITEMLSAEFSEDFKEEDKSEIIGNFQYPENPSAALKEALKKDIENRRLPMKISEVETVEFDSKEYLQIKINFMNESENVCIITFFHKHMEYEWDQSLDGKDNPSFTMAFKDPDNSQDMIIILTSVIKYLSPDLSYEEAERMAAKQDTTISTDGYAMPQDIGGYQIQALYTNPHVFFNTPDFQAKLGVKVRALKQIWKGTIVPSECQELLSQEDYACLSDRYNPWDEKNHPQIVYADFLVKNTWREQSHVHGETWVMVEVKSMTGRQYSFSLDTWSFPDAYEFGVGQQYTMYIRLNYSTGTGGEIIYAVQQTESAQFNSRGEAHPMDHPTDDWRDLPQRIEPEGEGSVYDVSFTLQSQDYSQRFAALEGHGIGEKQWPGDPEWEGYTFVGWYDNLEGKGNAYTKDTPIYEDTYLYAKWKYSGSGGTWPRAHRGDVQGIDEGSSFSVGQELTITACGYNMNLESPQEQRFRWYPVFWRLSEDIRGSFSDEMPFRGNLTLSKKGEQRLYITYMEEVFDGRDWQSTGQLYETEEALFHVD